MSFTKASDSSSCDRYGRSSGVALPCHMDAAILSRKAGLQWAYRRPIKPYLGSEVTGEYKKQWQGADLALRILWVHEHNITDLSSKQSHTTTTLISPSFANSAMSIERRPQSSPAM